MKNHVIYKKSQFYLHDDCDTLLVKLENIIHDYYISDIKCDIEKMEKDREILENAIKINDTKTMQYVLDNYSTLFKRYR